MDHFLKFAAGKTVFFIIAVLALWLNFSGHILSTLPLKKFLDGEFPSERYVFSRLVYNLEHGPAAQGGFMLAYNHVGALYKSVDRVDYADFKQRLESGETDFSLYMSHVGLQDDLLWPLWQGLQALKAFILDHAREGSRWHKRLQTLDLYYFYLITQALVALANAAALALILLWAARQFSLPTAWIALGLILVFLPPLTFFGRSAWWMMWSWFLPMLIVLWASWRAAPAPPGWTMTVLAGIAAGAAVCLKALMGYEFLSAVMVAAMVPLVFYAALNAWGVRRWFAVSFIIGGFCLAGALAALWLHWLALESYGLNAFEALRARFEMRAHGGETLAGATGEIPESAEAPFITVLLGYLVSPKEMAVPQLLFMAPFLVWLRAYLARDRKLQEETQRRMNDAFIAAIAVAFFGAVSMLFILKGHAYIHGFDVVVWCIPLNLVLTLFYAREITGLLRRGMRVAA